MEHRVSNAVLSILLAIVVVTCPIRCQFGGCCNEGESVAESVCCRDCSSPAAPMLPSEETGERCSCDCLCSGAILSSKVDLTMEELGVDHYEVEPYCDRHIQLPLQRKHRPPDPGCIVFDLSSINPGRKICCLISSLIL